MSSSSLDYGVKTSKVQASYRERVAGPEEGYVDAHGQLEALRLRFIERGRIELKSTSKKPIYPP